MTIAVRCAECEGKFRVSDEAAGKTGACPACGARITVPSVVAISTTTCSSCGSEVPTAGTQEVNGSLVCVNCIGVGERSDRARGAVGIVVGIGTLAAIVVTGGVWWLIAGGQSKTPVPAAPEVEAHGGPSGEESNETVVAVTPHEGGTPFPPPQYQAVPQGDTFELTQHLAQIDARVAARQSTLGQHRELVRELQDRADRYGEEAVIAALGEMLVEHGAEWAVWPRPQSRSMATSLVRTSLAHRGPDATLSLLNAISADPETEELARFRLFLAAARLHARELARTRVFDEELEAAANRLIDSGDGGVVAEAMEDYYRGAGGVLEGLMPRAMASIQAMAGWDQDSERIAGLRPLVASVSKWDLESCVNAIVGLVPQLVEEIGATRNRELQSDMVSVCDLLRTALSGARESGQERAGLTDEQVSVIAQLVDHIRHDVRVPNSIGHYDAEKSLESAGFWEQVEPVYEGLLDGRVESDAAVLGAWLSGGTRFRIVLNEGERRETELVGELHSYDAPERSVVATLTEPSADYSKKLIGTIQANNANGLSYIHFKAETRVDGEPETFIQFRRDDADPDGRLRVRVLWPGTTGFGWAELSD